MPERQIAYASNSRESHKLTPTPSTTGTSREIPTRTDGKAWPGSGESESTDEDRYVGEYQQGGEETEGCGWDGGGEELELK